MCIRDSNNPIWHNDKMGDKVVKDKDDDVSNRDFRKMKRYIKQLIKHSETFRIMYNDLDKRSETYTFKATNSDGGEAKDPMVISIGMKYTGNIKELNGIHPQRFELLGLLAHELGHTIRGLYGKDPKEPIEEERTSIKEDYTRKNNYAKDYVNCLLYTSRCV